MKFDIQKELVKKQLRATSARVSILKLFSNNCTLLSADDIYNKTKIKDKKINLVTVYRTLNSLEKVGIIRRVDLHTDSVQYELTLHHHHHIVCTKCGDREDFKLCNLNEFSQRILKKSTKFKLVENHAFELFGICKSCTA